MISEFQARVRKVLINVFIYSFLFTMQLTLPVANTKPGEDDVVIYIGHGTVTMKMKQAVREWATKRGIKQVNWGREKKINKAAKVQ